MTSQQAHYFITLADEGTFSKAAKILFVSQPSLSQFVKNLENQLGTILFERSTSPLKLTQSGMAFYRAAKKLQDIESDFMKELHDIQNKRTGTLIIGTTPFRASCMLPRSIAVFREKFPEIKVKLITDTMSRLNDLLEEGEIDLCVENDVFHRKEIITEDLSPETIYLAVPPTHEFNVGREEEALTSKDIKENTQRLYDCRGVSMDACRLLPFVVVKYQDSFFNMTQKLCEVHSFEPEIVMEAATIEMLFHWVRFGIGAAFLPDTLVKFGNLDNHPVYYKIMESETTIGGDTRSIVVAYKRERYLTQATKEYIHILKTLISLGTWRL